MKTSLPCYMFFLCAIVLFAGSGYAQGCSDSGFCTMGAMKPDQIYIPKVKFRINSVELTQHIGHTRFGDWIHSSFLDINVGITPKMNVQVRLPAYTTITGNMPTTQGWGDTYLNVNRTMVIHDKYQINLSLGGKLYNPAGSEKKSSEGQSMSTYQQTGYGSNDLVTSMSLISRKWLLAIGYRKPLNRMRDEFNHEQWRESPLYQTALVYPSSNRLLPGQDIILRVERNFRFSQWSFYAGILNIYRVTKDSEIDNSGHVVDIKGTDGLASNFIAGARYRLTIHSSIKLLASVRLRERDVNPDGLSRDFVGQLAYEIRF
ncbi:hypothetical protein BH09BAC3_BH09BAC3_27800 [soil metagenome]